MIFDSCTQIVNNYFGLKYICYQNAGTWSLKKHECSSYTQGIFRGILYCQCGPLLFMLEVMTLLQGLVLYAIRPTVSGKVIYKDKGLHLAVILTYCYLHKLKFYHLVRY
jgi:hypothetical protein